MNYANYKISLAENLIKSFSYGESFKLLMCIVVKQYHSRQFDDKSESLNILTYAAMPIFNAKFQANYKLLMLYNVCLASHYLAVNKVYSLL